MADHVEAEAQLVFALHPGQVVCVGVAAIVAPQRYPPLRLAIGAERVEGKRRKSAVSNVGAVSAGNTEYVGAVVRAEVFTNDVLVLVCDTPVRIEEQRG